MRERVAQTRAKLPIEVKEPSVARFDVGAAPILTYTLSGAGRSLPEIGQFARDVIKPSLEQVDGVASVEIRNLIVATASDGSSVKLSDIGRVEDGFEELRWRSELPSKATKRASSVRAKTTFPSAYDSGKATPRRWTASCR